MCLISSIIIVANIIGMNEFNEILEYLSEDASTPLDIMPTNSIPVYNYHELEQSQASQQRKSHTVIEPSIQQNQRPDTKYNMLMPSPQQQGKPLERNSQAKTKQVIKTVKDVRETKLRIIDLEDDIDEEIIEKSREEVEEEEVQPQKEVVVSYKPFLPLIIQEPKDEANRQKDKAQLKPTLPQPSKKEEVPRQSDQSNLKSNVLFTRSKVSLKQVERGKNRYYNEESEIYNFGSKFQSNNSLDTAMNANSIMTSRDQLSTRNIISYPERKRKILPELKPYKQISDQKMTTIPSFQNLNQDIPTPIIYKKPRLVSAHQITNVGEFVRQQIEVGRRLECGLIRNKTCSKRFFLDYDLQTNDGKFLMSCKKMGFCLNSTYNISLINGVYDQKSENFLGKVEGNFTGSIFNVFTYDASSVQPKQMVATIAYNSNCSWCEQQYRQFQLYVKNDNYKYYELSGTELVKGSNLMDLYGVDANRTSGMIRKYVTKQPKWSEQQQAYVINFRGKCKKASVKNAIVVEEDRPHQQLLLLAKQDTDKFAFDISHPFSPLVAFALMITGFDFKLASQ